ncbi:MAG TPA: hypothetical protein VJ719_15345 [Chthoniobacterales bacterium]|nr:hypothetical protein [Chthoniobacterales bacterium]
MTHFPVSNWLRLAPADYSKLALPAISRRQPESFSLVELKRSLSRWENEGGAIPETISPPQSVETSLPQNL